MNRCRRTEAIAEVVADPALGVEALTDEQHDHVAICADCHALVTGLERLDAGLTVGLRSLRREEMPAAVLATPAIPRRDSEWPAPMGFLAAAAVVVLAVGAVVAGGAWLDGTNVGLGPDPAPSVTASSGASFVPVATSTTVASASPGEPTPTAAATPEAGPAIIEVGAIVAVVDEPLVVRTTPGTEDASTITDDRLWLGQRVRILDGPVETNGYTWWDVAVGEIRGWVADAERDDSAPWLAPLGNGRIAYADPMGTGATRIWTMAADGSEPSVLADLDGEAGIRLVLSCGGGATPAGWTHDGSWLAFDYAIGGCDRTVGMVRADGSGLRVVGPGHWPAWRPDGQALTYGENVPYQPCGRDCGGDDDDGPWELLEVEIGGGEPAPFTTSEAWTSASMPAWAPDRLTVAFSRWITPETNTFAGGFSEIHLADGNGEDPRSLVEGQMPTWSPDGRWVVFTRVDPDTGASVLHRIRPDGSGLEAIGEGDAPQFAPDGSRLALIREGGVFTMAPDGRDVSLAIPGSMVDGIDWSPDGRHLVAAIDYAGSYGLYRVALGGAAPSITGLGQEGSWPAWQPLLLDPRLAD